MRFLRASRACRISSSISSSLMSRTPLACASARNAMKARIAPSREISTSGAAMTKGKSVIRIAFVALGWAALIWFFYYAGTAVVVAEWFLLSLWLIPFIVRPMVFISFILRVPLSADSSML